MASLIFYDSILFVFFLVVAFLFISWVSRKYSLGGYPKLFLWLYTLCSFSSYNIMVKPIHDYNLAIPRTFIYHFKVIGPLAPIDIAFLALLLVVFLKKFSSGHFRTFEMDKISSGIIKIIILQAIFLGLISTIGFITYYNNGGIGTWNDQVIYCRGVIYFFVLVYIFQQSIKKFKSLNFLTLLSIFCVLDIINFFSGLMSSFIFTDYVWDRYGVKITIIDQDKIYNYFTMYAMLIISYLFVRPARNAFVYFTIIVIGCFIFINIYKYIYAVAIIYVIYEVVVNAIRGRLAVFKIALFSIAGVALISVILMLSTSKAINTRSSQLTDYWEYTGSKFPAVLFGIGYGGKFYSPTETDDLGEVKEIDAETGTPNYRKSVQTPLVTNIKSGGTVGLIVAILFALLSFLYIFRLNLSFPINPISNAICFNIILLMGSTSVILQPYIMPALALIKLLIILTVYIVNLDKKELPS